MTKITQHWLEIALERIKAGDEEIDVMADYGYVPKSEIIELRAGIEKLKTDKLGIGVIRWKDYWSNAQNVINNLLTPTVPSKNPTDKDTGITKQMVDGAIEFNEKCPPTELELKDKEFSPWYDYKGEVDFKDGIVVECEYFETGIHQHILSGGVRPEWEYIKRYRIKLDGVKVIENFNDVLGLEDGYMGYDRDNRLLIVRDKE